MSNKGIVLLRTMMASTGRINVIKHSQDSKKKSAAYMALFGIIFLGVIVVGISGLYGYALAYFGFAKLVPTFAASAICLMALVFTVLKSNGYLYAFKEYDMLMAMPFSVRTIVADRFLFMYLQSLIWDVLISLGALIGCSIAVSMPVKNIVVWILLSPFVPLVPTVVASLLGVLVADIGSRVRHKKLIQIVLTFILVIPLFFLQYISDYLFKNDKVGDVIDQSAQAVSGIAKLLPTVGWFEESVNAFEISSILLFVGVSLVVYTVAVLFIGATYKRINSGLENAASRRKKSHISVDYKRKSVIKSIAFKEFKRITGSTVSAVNLGMGAVLSILFGLILPFINIESALNSMSKGQPVDLSSFTLIWPVAVYFLVGMVPSTAPSPSLEGKNNWIMQSMPIDPMTVCKGRMLFNLYLNLIPGIFVTVTGLISLRAKFLDFVLGILMITTMVLFSTAYGMRCGLKHVNLDWENEVQVVKQGAAVAIYLLPNMLATMIAGCFMGVFSYFVSGKLGALILIAVYGILGIWSLHAVKRYAK